MLVTIIICTCTSRFQKLNMLSHKIHKYQIYNVLKTSSRYIMFSIKVYHQNAHTSFKYVASPIFVFAHKWLNLNTAYEINANERHPKHTLSMTHSLLPAEVIVVRIVPNTNLYCNPVSTFHEDHPLHESKFELLLMWPNHQSFGPNYDLTTKQLSITQHSASP